MAKAKAMVSNMQGLSLQQDVPLNFAAFVAGHWLPDDQDNGKVYVNKTFT